MSELEPLKVGDRFTIGDDPRPYTVTYVGKRVLDPSFAEQLSEGKPANRKEPKP